MDNLPRSFQQPLALAMDSPISTGSFTVWPPTPRHVEDSPTVIDSHYPFSMADCSPSGDGVTAPWAGEITPHTPHMAPNGVDIPCSPHYGQQQESEPSTVVSAWWGNDTDGVSGDWRPRVGYSLLEGNAETDHSSSYGSSSGGNGFLPVPSYQYAQQPSDPLRLNTDLDARNHLSDEISSAEPIATSTTSYYAESDSSLYTTEFRTPLMSAVTTPHSPSVRSVSRTSRGSCSPIYRVTPYSATDKKRWSAPGDSSNFYSLSLDPQLQGSQLRSHHSSPIRTPPHTLPPSTQSYLPSHQHTLPRNMTYLPGFLDRGHPHHPHPHHHHHEPTQLMPSPFYIPSHPENHHHARYADYAERPDLYSCLTEEQIPPPEEDMNPADPEMKPHEQDLRFEGDLYTPRWVRGHGNKREGWCGICKPGRWLVLKNSAFWYDKSFTHGISAATGQPFAEPRDMRRMDGNPDVWEGLCHSCAEWVPLVSNKKKGTTWFRHAYKCHTHNKIRDAPKRRREGSLNKKIKAAST
ncbi:hypothetical protein BZA05DRAFT_396511 [Tricharina praecox]|uniref:uncharacterized protein n=1 Tax=Tricharina praecox TaxID=43433 RepID=UPI00221FB4AC|nr:uncharacterized protein BZA05DRAFT_396511 [Tricharina praecox]KAI5853562.1 hypothetical protein BZA05DRAFT_396511 [Tricharina praecox]